MKDDIQAFTPLTVDTPEEPAEPGAFTDVFPTDDGPRLSLDASAPSLEMEELPAFDLTDSLPPLDNPEDALGENAPEQDASPIEPLPTLDTDASALGEDSAVDADPFADLAMDAPAETADIADADPFADLGETADVGPDIQVQVSGGEADGRLVLPEILDLDQAENLRATLLERIGTHLTIDAAAVSRIDTPCLEVAIAAAKQWSDDGFSLDWESPSETFAASLDRLGLSIDFLRIEGAH